MDVTIYSLGFGTWGLGIFSPVMEKKMGKTMENEKNTGMIMDLSTGKGRLSVSNSKALSAYKIQRPSGLHQASMLVYAYGRGFACYFEDLGSRSWTLMCRLLGLRRRLGKSRSSNY